MSANEEAQTSFVKFMFIHRPSHRRQTSLRSILSESTRNECIEKNLSLLMTFKKLNSIDVIFAESIQILPSILYKSTS